MPPTAPLTIGQPAPEFTLPASTGDKTSLTDFRGKHTVLVFYPLDFSPTCSLQLPEYSSRKSDFESLDAEVVGVSRDSVYTHRAWIAELGLEVPLLADMTGEVARAYGVFLEERGVSKRAVFIVDKEGILRFQHVEATPGDFTLHTDDILAELRSL